MALLISNATVATKRGGQTINAALPAFITPPKQEQILMSGGAVVYVVAVDPVATIRENDQLFVTACPSNPALINVKPFSISAVRQEADITGHLAVTLFNATQKVQT